MPSNLIIFFLTLNNTHKYTLTFFKIIKQYLLSYHPAVFADVITVSTTTSVHKLSAPLTF